MIMNLLSIGCPWGEYLCDAERDDEAKIVYEYLADHFPENEETWLDYSDFYVLQDEIDVAIGVLYEGLEKQPDNISYIYRMANYLFLKAMWCKQRRICKWLI